MPGQKKPPLFFTAEIVEIFPFFRVIFFALVPHSVTRGDAAFSPSTLPHRNPDFLCIFIIFC